MRVLLFSNDLMPFGTLPTSGGGLRCWQLMRGLESRGIEVIASMPSFTFLARQHASEIPAEQQANLWGFGTQDEILWRVKPDAVLFASNWDHFDLHTPLDLPLIVDLHGSRLLETRMWGQGVSAERKIQVFHRADCLLAAGERQRLYFSGWLIQAGRVPEWEHFIRYIPISLSPELPAHQHEVNENTPRFVSGGGWFPWQDQSRALFALCRRVQSEARGSVEIYGGPHEKMGDTPEERRIFETYHAVMKIAEATARVKVQGYVGRDELLRIYSSASVAVEVMRRNLERELAFTTRTIEYLWCGLPVIYSDVGEVGEHIREYDAGWIVDPENERAVIETLDQIYSDPIIVRTKSENAQRLVRDRFTWDKTIEPLVEFLQNPKTIPRGKPALGSVCSQPSFLAVRGEPAEIPLSASRNEASTHFIVPAEDIAVVEVPISLASEAAHTKISQIELIVRRPSGRILARRILRAEQIPQRGRVAIKLGLLSQPEGGTALEFVLRLTPVPGTPPTDSLLLVQGVKRARFPLISDDAKDNQTFFALSFSPGDSSPVYRAKVLARRAIQMLHDGEWRRLSRAVRRRIPGLMYQIRQKAKGRFARDA